LDGPNNGFVQFSLLRSALPWVYSRQCEYTQDGRIPGWSGHPNSQSVLRS